MMSADAYFASVAMEVFARTLEDLGARLVGADPWVVRYETNDWFVELIALWTDGPKYCPRVTIGPLPERDILTRNKQFDILHTLPLDSPMRRYNLEWRYTNANEMRRSYQRVLKDIFEPHSISVLSNKDHLLRLMEFRSNQVERQWHDEIRDHNESVCRSKAKRALDGKDYATYLSEMAQIPLERQRASERARVKHVRKNLSRI